MRHEMTEEEILEQQKDAAIRVLKETTVHKKDVDLVPNDGYNKQLVGKIEKVEEKIDQLDLIFS